MTCCASGRSGKPLAVRSEARPSWLCAATPSQRRATNEQTSRSAGETANPQTGLTGQGATVAPSLRARRGVAGREVDGLAHPRVPRPPPASPTDAALALGPIALA